VELSIYPLVSMLKRARLGDPHPVLTGGERYISHRFADEAERWLDAELAAAGLSDRNQLADFTGMLAIIQRAQTEFYGWITNDDETYAVLVAAHGRNAFALTRRGDRVAFRRIGPDRLAAALLEELADVPPGRGEAISVREVEVAGAGPRPVLRRASGVARSEQARRLDALFRTPRRGGAKLYAARRDDAGNRLRSQAWLDLIDLPDGRWAVYTTTSRGERTVHAVAATARFVGEKLDDLLRTAHAR
jgi:hypothetical protein